MGHTSCMGSMRATTSWCPQRTPPSNGFSPLHYKPICFFQMVLFRCVIVYWQFLIMIFQDHQMCIHHHQWLLLMLFVSCSGNSTRLQNNELPCVFQKHTPRNMHFNDYRHSWLCVNKRGLFHYNQCWGIAAFKSCSSGKFQKKNTKLCPCCSCVC